MRLRKIVLRQIFRSILQLLSSMKYESSSDVPVLLTTLFLRRDTPWRRKMKHRIGFKEMYFQIDFTCRIPFPVK